MNCAVQKQSKLFFEADHSQATQITRQIWTTHRANDSGILRFSTIILRVVPDISKHHGAFIFSLGPIAPEREGTTILPNIRSYSQNNKVPERLNLQQNCCENLKSQNKWTLLLLRSYSKTAIHLNYIQAVCRRDRKPLILFKTPNLFTISHLC
jgi:hypothetical protein